jgi:RNA polymerase sigma-70 factor (ECF subfamily)
VTKPVPNARATGELLQLRPKARVEEMSDAGLVAACAAADRTARALLFERHVDAIHRFVGRMRGSDADAVDDLVQATFVRAFQAAGRFRGTSARSWLYGIAANVVREHARKEIRRKRALSLVAEELPRVTPGHDLMLAKLPEAIAGLPHELRAAFVLIDLEGEKGTDAALALGVPEGTLWRRVFNARAALRKVLAGGGS